METVFSEIRAEYGFPALPVSDPLPPLEASIGETIGAQTWDDYIGQTKVKERLSVHIDAAVKEYRNLEHTFLAGPPGIGKTVLSRLIANQLGDGFIAMKMPVHERELVRVIRAWEGGVLLLDELHAAPKAFQEMLLTALQGGYIQTADMMVTRTDHVTFIGATTEPRKIIRPLYDRFLLKPTFVEYTDAEMCQILEGMAGRAGIELPAGVAEGVCRAAGGTPRIAGSLILAARDLHAIGRPVTAASVLDLIGVDSDGLSDQHLIYLRTLEQLGNSSGVDNICSMMQIDQATIEDLERLLVARGMLTRSSRGRSLTPKAMMKLPAPTPPSAAVRRQRSTNVA